MKIQQIPISKLKPAPYNPREISDDSLDRLRKSIEQFGSVEPLVWNKKTGHVVGGNQRLKLYQEQGLKKVSCSVVELTRKQEKILNLRLNNMAGTWDLPKLGDMLKALDEVDWALTGFENFEIGSFIPGRLELPTDADGKEYDESAADGVKLAKCPKCQHEFPI